MAIPAAGFTRGVAAIDSLTKANSSPINGVGYTEIISTLDPSIVCVKRGVSGRTLAGMVTAFSSEIPTAGCGPNLITNSEFYTDVSGWVEEATESSISQFIGPANVAAMRITNNDATGGITYSQVDDLDTAKEYVYSGRQPPSSSFDPRLFAGSTPGGLQELGGELVDTFSQRSFTPSVSTVYFTVQNSAIGSPNSCDVTELEVRENLAPQFFVLLGGINDVSGGATEAAMSANRDTLVSDAVAAGIEPILCTVTPWNSASGAQQIVMDDYNTATRAAAISGNYDLIDAYVEFEDPASPDDLNPLYDNGDGLHWNTAGQTFFAQLLLGKLRGVVNYFHGAVKDSSTVTPQAPEASPVTPIGGLCSSIIGVCTNEAQEPTNRVFSDDQAANHDARLIGGVAAGGSEGTDFTTVSGASEGVMGKAVRYETATAPTNPDAAFPNTYLNKTDPAVTVDTDEATFSVEP